MNDRHDNMTGNKPNNHLDSDGRHTTGKKSRNYYGLGLVFIAAIAVASLIIWLPINTSTQKTPQKMPRNSDAEVTNAPISLIPETPEGITIVEKMPERADLPNPALAAPIAQGASTASGYAMDLGSALSYIDLTTRFASIVELNAEQAFQSLEPRAMLNETQGGLQARLLVGPFTSFSEADQACKSTILPQTIKCRPGTFEGDLIARTP